MAIIGKHGTLRMQRFGSFDPDYGEKLIRALLDEQFEAEKQACPGRPARPYGPVLSEIRACLLVPSLNRVALQLGRLSDPWRTLLWPGTLRHTVFPEF